MEQLPNDTNNVEQIDTNKKLLDELSKYYNNEIDKTNWVYNSIDVSNSRYEHTYERYCIIHDIYCKSVKENGILKKLLELNIEICEYIKEIKEEDVKLDRAFLKRYHELAKSSN